MPAIKQEEAWKVHFPVRADSDFYFTIGGDWPIAMSHASPPEFKRRILAAAASYKLRLRSIDGTLKRYVEPDQFEKIETTFGGTASAFLRDCRRILTNELRKLHTPEPTFGQFGAEITLFKLPQMLDAARILANNGLFLEVLPILRLMLEQISWSIVAFFSSTDLQVRKLEGNDCISRMTAVYSGAGRLYGYFSKFSHWSHEVHRNFLHLSDDGVTSVIDASPRQRAISLVLCLITLDLMVEAIRHIYRAGGESLASAIQGTSDRSEARRCHQLVEEIVVATNLPEIIELQRLLS